MQPKDIDEFFRRLAIERPEPKTELNSINPYTLLVAVVLSAQMTDAGVNRATEKLFAVAQTPAQMLALGEDKLKDYIKTVGLFRGKAKNVIALSQILVDRFDGAIPRTRVDLQSLPGVGRKTANVVLNVVYGEPTMAVDTHVYRVANRTGMAKGDTPEKVEEKLSERLFHREMDVTCASLADPAWPLHLARRELPLCPSPVSCATCARSRTRRKALTEKPVVKKKLP